MRGKAQPDGRSAVELMHPMDSIICQVTAQVDTSG